MTSLAKHKTRSWQNSRSEEDYELGGRRLGAQMRCASPNESSFASLDFAAGAPGIITTTSNYQANTYSLSDANSLVNS